MDMAGLRELLAAGDAYRVIGRVKDYFSALPSAEWIAVRGGGHLLHWTHVDTIVVAVQAHEDA